MVAAVGASRVVSAHDGRTRARNAVRTETETGCVDARATVTILAVTANQKNCFKSTAADALGWVAGTLCAASRVAATAAAGGGGTGALHCVRGVYVVVVSE